MKIVNLKLKIMIEVYCDGGARGNPGPAAYGFVVKAGGQPIKREGKAIGIATNNFAEYTAVIAALKWLVQDYQGQDLNFFLDSKLAVSQLSGLYKIKSATIRNLVFEIKTQESKFGQIRYNYIPREKNKEADRLVNLALDGKI